MNFIHHQASAAGVILLALLVGFFFISAHEPGGPHQTTNPQHGAAARELAAAVTEHSDEALADMHAYMDRNLSAYADVPGTFGGTSTWSAGWHLHWLDVAYRGNTVRLYHLSAKDNSGRRFIVATTPHDEKPKDWTPVN